MSLQILFPETPSRLRCNNCYYTGCEKIPNKIDREMKDNVVQSFNDGRHSPEDQDRGKGDGCYECFMPCVDSFRYRLSIVLQISHRKGKANRPIKREIA